MGLHELLAAGGAGGAGAGWSVAALLAADCTAADAARDLAGPIGMT